MFGRPRRRLVVWTVGSRSVPRSTPVRHLP